MISIFYVITEEKIDVFTAHSGIMNNIVISRICFIVIKYHPLTPSY